MDLEGRDYEIIDILFRFLLGSIDKNHENFAVITEILGID
jgi:hypothetical protein